MTTITQENTTTTTTNIPVIESKEPEMKTVYRGYCIRTDLSSTLDEETLYYLEHHNKTHFYVSKFPSASKSQMGVYDATRFKVVREELIPVNPVRTVKTPTKTLVQKLREQDEADMAQNTIAFVDDNEQAEPIAENTAVVQVQPNQPQIDLAQLSDEQEEVVEPLKAKDLMFAEHFNVQDLEALPAQGPTLEQGKLYQAKLIYRSVSFARYEQGSIFYIAAKDLDHPYYNETTCNVYDDAAGQNFRGVWSTRWFEILSTVEDPYLEEVPTEEVQTEQVESVEPVSVEAISEQQEPVREVEIEKVEPIFEEVVQAPQEDVKELSETNAIDETAKNEATIEKEDEAEPTLATFNLFDAIFEANNNSKPKRKKTSAPKEDDSQIEFNLFDF